MASYSGGLHPQAYGAYYGAPAYDVGAYYAVSDDGVSYAYEPQVDPSVSAFPYNQFAPDGYLHALAFQGPGYQQIMPEGWEDFYPLSQEQTNFAVEPDPTTSGKGKKKRDKKPDKKPKVISEELARRIQAQLQSASRATPLRKIFGKYDTDRSGSLSATEFKKLIRKEMRISNGIISDVDIDALSAALDTDGEGTLSIEEVVEFIDKGSCAFFKGSTANSAAAPPAPEEEGGGIAGDEAAPVLSSSFNPADSGEEEDAGEQGEEEEKRKSSKAHKSSKTDDAKKGGATKKSTPVKDGCNMLFLPLGSMLINTPPTPRKTQRRAATAGTVNRPRKEAVYDSTMKSGKGEEDTLDATGSSTIERKDGTERRKSNAYWLRGSSSSGKRVPSRSSQYGLGTADSQGRRSPSRADGPATARKGEVVDGKLVFQTPSPLQP